MSDKKSVKKAPVKKKVVAKKVSRVAKVVDLTKVKPITGKVVMVSKFEDSVLDKIAALQESGFAVTLKCEGRNKQVKSGECVLEYIRANKPIELVGMKSGMAARTVQL